MRPLTSFCGLDLLSKYKACKGVSLRTLCGTFGSGFLCRLPWPDSLVCPFESWVRPLSSPSDSGNRDVESSWKRGLSGPTCKELQPLSCIQ